MTSQTTEIIYVGDPMCSWCYGFTEELTKFKAQNSDIPFSIIVGGLRKSGDQEWNPQFTTFLKEHWEDINQRTGMPFSYDLLKWDEFDYNTEPACRAVVVASDMNAEKELDFFKAIQKKFYFGNKDPKQVGFYESICEELGYSYETFSKNFNSEKYRQKTTQQFQLAQNLNARSFPSMLLKHNGEYYLIGRGYTSAEALQQAMDGVVK